jgi:hypothetical protein
MDMKPKKSKELSFCWWGGMSSSSIPVIALSSLSEPPSTSLSLVVSVPDARGGQTAPSQSVPPTLLLGTLVPVVVRVAHEAGSAHLAEALRFECCLVAPGRGPLLPDGFAGSQPMGLAVRAQGGGAMRRVGPAEVEYSLELVVAAPPAALRGSVLLEARAQPALGSSSKHRKAEHWVATTPVKIRAPLRVSCLALPLGHGLLLRLVLENASSSCPLALTDVELHLAATVLEVASAGRKRGSTRAAKAASGGKAGDPALMLVQQQVQQFLASSAGKESARERSGTVSAGGGDPRGEAKRAKPEPALPQPPAASRPALEFLGAAALRGGGGAAGPLYAFKDLYAASPVGALLEAQPHELGPGEAYAVVFRVEPTQVDAPALPPGSFFSPLTVSWRCAATLLPVQTPFWVRWARPRRDDLQVCAEVPRPISLLVPFTVVLTVTNRMSNHTPDLWVTLHGAHGCPTAAGAAYERSGLVPAAGLIAPFAHIRPRGATGQQPRESSSSPRSSRLQSRVEHRRVSSTVNDLRMSISPGGPGAPRHAAAGAPQVTVTSSAPPSSNPGAALHLGSKMAASPSFDDLGDIVVATQSEPIGAKPIAAGRSTLQVDALALQDAPVPAPRRKTVSRRRGASLDDLANEEREGQAGMAASDIPMRPAATSDASAPAGAAAASSDSFTVASTASALPGSRRGAHFGSVHRDTTGGDSSDGEFTLDPSLLSEVDSASWAPMAVEAKAALFLGPQAPTDQPPATEEPHLVIPLTKGAHLGLVSPGKSVSFSLQFVALKSGISHLSGIIIYDAIKGQQLKVTAPMEIDCEM